MRKLKTKEKNTLIIIPLFALIIIFIIGDNSFYELTIEESFIQLERKLLIIFILIIISNSYLFFLLLKLNKNSDYDYNWNIQLKENYIKT